MFLQIHTLTSYHATLLNRDDAGLAKRIPFGDATRLRVSSQCLKRHWREKLQELLTIPGGWRSRHFFARQVFPRVCEAGVEEAKARSLVRTLIQTLMKEKESKSGARAKTGEEGSEGTVADKEGRQTGIDPLFLNQPVLFGKPEADYLVSLVVQASQEGDLKQAQGYIESKLKEQKSNFASMLRQNGHGSLHAGFEGAMFGRFVTSDILARVDAPVHVAHSFTVHGLDTEIDYFTVVDDLNLDEETGAAHAGDMEIGGGVYYGYVAVDVPLLVSNTSGCDQAEWRSQDRDGNVALLKALIEAITTVSPGAKRGGTAPYAYSDLLLLEAGKKQPRSLANSFLRAIPARGDVTQEAADALSRQMAAMDMMYGPTAEIRSLATTKTWLDSTFEKVTVSECSERVLNHIFENIGNGRSNS